MTAELSYFSTVSTNGQISRAPITQANGGTQSLSLTSSPANMNAAPTGAMIFCIQATEAMRYEYGAGVAVTATSHYLPAGVERWHDVEAGKLLSVRTA